MATAKLNKARMAGIASAVPAGIYDNVKDASGFNPVDVKKVVAMAGVKERRISDGSICSTDLCYAASRELLDKLNWKPETIDLIIFVTQTPDYFLPSSSCLLHKALNLSEKCAAFDVGLGCSGYPYGLWLAHMAVQTGAAKRALVLHGETPSLFTDKEDRATFLLFGDGGSATAIEFEESQEHWGYSLHSDGQGYSDLIIPGGGFRQRKVEDERDLCVYMNGTNLFNFTVQRVPELISQTLTLMKADVESTDLFIFHQSNKFIMKHIGKKVGLPEAKVPLILNRFGNSGGASVPIALVQSLLENPPEDRVAVLMLGYGVGLSWGSAYVFIDKDIVYSHLDVDHALLDLHHFERGDKENVR